MMEILYVSTIVLLSPGGAVAARMAHNHQVAGSNPAPATRILAITNVFVGIHSIVHLVYYTVL